MLFCRLNAGILTLCERQTKVYSLSFWILSIFCCRIIIKTIKSNKLFLRNQYLVNPIMCSRTSCVLYFAFKFLWSNFKYILLFALDCWHEWNTWFLFLLIPKKKDTTDSTWRIHLSPLSGLTNVVPMKIVFLHGLRIASKISGAFVSCADTVGSPWKYKLCSFSF